MGAKELADYLIQLRKDADRSLRWVERKSRELHPDDSERQISNAYLNQIETGYGFAVSPAKLRTLAQIYKVDYLYLLELAGYLDKEPGTSTDKIVEALHRLPKAKQELVYQLIKDLSG
jgi:transcriptional regulator with XRE-family HTH domain